MIWHIYSRGFVHVTRRLYSSHFRIGVAIPTAITVAPPLHVLGACFSGMNVVLSIDYIQTRSTETHRTPHDKNIISVDFKILFVQLGVHVADSS